MRIVLYIIAIFILIYVGCSHKEFNALYNEAAEGDVNAQYELGIRYFENKDPYLRDRDRYGAIENKYNRDWMHYFPKDTLVNKRKATYWINKAMENGSKDAIRYWNLHKLSKYK